MVSICFRGGKKFLRSPADPAAHEYDRAGTSTGTVVSFS
jgi:hypothetical protein